MGKHRKPKLRRPSDNLPPRKLQEAWTNYLDETVGRQGARPRWEVLVDPKKMDVIMYDSIRELEQKTETSRAEVYLTACRRVIDDLPVLQRVPLKQYFGIGVSYPMTHEEIAAYLGIDQSNATRRIATGLKNLRQLVRKELANVVREKLQQNDESVL